MKGNGRAGAGGNAFGFECNGRYREIGAGKGRVECAGTVVNSASRVVTLVLQSRIQGSTGIDGYYLKVSRIEVKIGVYADDVLPVRLSLDSDVNRSTGINRCGSRRQDQVNHGTHCASRYLVPGHNR